jgi:hypothetical protein
MASKRFRNSLHFSSIMALKNRTVVTLILFLEQ